MLVVETIAKIRRAFFHQKKPIKTICRELKLSRKAVRKAIRSEETEFRYERSVQQMPKLGARRSLPVRLEPTVVMGVTMVVKAPHVRLRRSGCLGNRDQSRQGRQAKDWPRSNS